MIKIGKTASYISTYTCHPKSKKELRNIVEERIAKEGRHCDLNDIDVSEVTDMSNLFSFSVFDGDISNWDVSNVEHMSNMFSNCEFNGDISRWNTSRVKSMMCMFEYSKFNGDISNWDLRSVKDMSWMFCGGVFNQDISNWKISKNCIVNDVFVGCSIEEKHKPKI